MLSTLTDPLDKTWTATYSGVDLLTLQDPLRQLLKVEYTQQGQPHVPTLVTDEAGYFHETLGLVKGTWEFTYNTQGQMTQAKPPTGSTSAARNFAYYEAADNLPDFLGYPKETSDNANVVTASFPSYDPLGDLLGITTYPTAGNGFTTTFEVDGYQRLTKVIHPDTKQALWNYAGSQLQSVVDEKGTTYVFGYCDPCGALTSILGPSVNNQAWSLGWEYDRDGDLLTFTDARGYDTTYVYGQAKELKQVLLPGNGAPKVAGSFEYNGYGEVKKVTNGRGQAIELLYDNGGRVYGIAPLNGAPGGSVQFDYDDDDRLETMQDAAGITRFTYHPNGWLYTVEYDYTASGLAQKQRLTYRYYKEGLRKNVLWERFQNNAWQPVGTWTYGYNTRGVMTNVTNSWNEVTSFGYDNEDKITLKSSKYNTNQSVMLTSYGYNQARGWVTQIRSYLVAGNTTIGQFNLEYDGNPADTVGLLTKVNEWVRDENNVLLTSEAEYEYDALYRLKYADRDQGSGAYGHKYGYDLAGNRTSKETLVGMSWLTETFTFAPANEYAGVPAGYAFDYDDDGNLTEWKIPDYSTAFLHWNAYSQLTKRTGNAIVIPEFAYDGMGRRVHTWATEGVTPRFFIFDGDLLLGEVEPDGDPLKAYTWGANGLISECTAVGSSFNSAQSRWHVFGPQGETRAVVNSAGAVQGTLSYTAYGEVLSNTGIVETLLRYGGQWGYYTQDGMNGMLLCGFRWYDPRQGRWLSRDPIGYAGGPNLYEYCYSDPVNLADPLGSSGVDLDSVRASIRQAVISRDWQTLRFILQSLPPMTAAALQRVTQPLQNHLQRLFEPILSKIKPSDLKCVEAANQLQLELEKRGIPYRVIELQKNVPLYVQKLSIVEKLKFWQRPEIYSKTGNHTAIEVGGRVYDSITGAKGLPFKEWLQRAGVQASDVKDVFIRVFDDIYQSFPQ